MDEESFILFLLLMFTRIL